MWDPQFAASPLPLYERLVLAMREDMLAGRLQPGTRLPPQRDLAFRLGISVGSVTRAYAEAERRGLLQAHVGRGSFVRGEAPADEAMPASTQPDKNAPIDLQRNIPPAVPLMTTLDDALNALLARGTLAPALHYAPASGLPQIRTAAARWISQTYGLNFAAEDLIQCNGGQHAIALVFSAFCARGEAILCESSGFYGARMAAEHLGLRLHGLPMDDEGLLPDAVDEAARQTGSRLLFTLPTLHNPTTRTMSDQRRQQIAAIARARDLLIFEDDAYYAYSERPRQIAFYAPERTIYLASLSKGCCPGLRLAFLALPPGLPRERLMQGIHALGYCPPTLGALVFSEWVETGQIDMIAQSIQAEAAARWGLAQSILGGVIAPAGANYSPHAWLPMPALQAERMAARLLRAGVDVTPPESAMICEQADTGLRLCLGAPQTRQELSRALHIVAETLLRPDYAERDGII